MVKKVNKKHLAISCVSVVLLQLIAMYVGFSLTELLYRKNPVSDEALLGEIIAFVIFLALGIRLMVLAVKNEWVLEHLETKFETAGLIRLGGRCGIYTLLAGIAFGCVRSNFTITMLSLMIVSIVFIIAGTYFGYHYGFEQKRKAYIVGAVLLWIAGIDVLLRQILQLF